MKITKEQLQEMIKEELGGAIKEAEVDFSPKLKRQQPIAYVKYSLYIPVYSHELPDVKEPSDSRDDEIAEAADLKINKMDSAALVLSLEYEEVVGYDA
jgi:hypothetical protein